MDTSNLCIRCNMEFNFQRKCPVQLPCSHFMCLECRDKVMQANRGDPLMKIIKCPGCKKESQFNIREMDQKVADYKLAHKEECRTPFVCYQHEGEKLVWFIGKLGQFYCEKCIIELQIDKKHCEPCTDETISKHAAYVVEKLQELQEQTNNMIHKVRHLEKMNGKFNSKQIMRNFTEAKQIITGKYIDFDTAEHLKKYERTQEESKLGDDDRDQDSLESLLITQMDSVIIEKPKDQHNIADLCQEVGTDKKKFFLLYRGSRDGFQSKSFHNKADGRGATLTII